MPLNAVLSGPMMLKYGLTGAGWATVTLECGDQTVEMTASYLHDSLSQLARAARDLGKTGSESVVFMDEPGEHHLLLRQANDEVAEVEVVWFDDWKSWNEPVGPAQRKLLGVVRVAEFREQVISELRRLLHENGEEGYRKKWIQHDFPVEELRELEAAG